MLVAGVDSSTQSVKIVVRDAKSGKFVRSAFAQHPDGSEVNPEDWWQALQRALHDVGGLDDVEAISIAGQQHGMVALDSDGNVIRDALLWNDTRSAPQAAALNREFPDIHLQTGSALVASFTASKVRWVAENEPANAAKISAIALPHDWLSWKLSGSTDISDIFTDRSDASGTGYFDPVANKYIEPIISHALGATRKVHLPRIIKPFEFGAINKSGIKIGAGAGDNAGAALGLGAQVGDLIISLGTSGTAFGVSATPSHDSSGEVAGFADATGNFLPLACTLNAARVFDAVAKSLGVSLDEFSTLALSAPPGANDLMMLPHFDGERTPNLPNAKGQLIGITHKNFTKENIARAAVEGVIAAIHYASGALTRSGMKWNRIMLIGGAAKNPAVQRVAAQFFQSEILIPEPDEYVANGAARQAATALLGLGELISWQNVSVSKITDATDGDGKVISDSYLDLLKNLLD